MNKSGFFKPDFDERGLHAGEHARHAPFVNITSNIALLSAFNVNLNEGVIFQQSHPRFLGSRIDNNPLSHV